MSILDDMNKHRLIGGIRAELENICRAMERANTLKEIEIQTKIAVLIMEFDVNGEKAWVSAYNEAGAILTEAYRGSIKRK